MRLLYYAMVLRNSYPQNTPIPIVEYISSRHQEFSKIDQLCSTTAETGCNEKGLPGLQSDSLEKNDESDECQCIDPEEQWNKPRPQKQTKNKGKYLTPSDKRLNFDPRLSSTQTVREEQKKKKAKI